MKNLTLKQTWWKMIDETKDELLDLCSQLLQRPSINPPINADEITNYIVNYLKENEIPYELVYNKPNMPIIIATVGNSEGKTLCINGHTDIVLPGDLSKWEFDPHCGTITETQVRGRGASDMLCGVALALHIAKLIVKNKIKIKGKLVLHLVSDEESGGQYCSKWLVENGYAKEIDAVMLPEPTSYNNVESGSKGSVTAIIKCYGTQAHGSVCSFVGDNAIAKMIRILSRVEELRTMQAIYEEHQLPVVANSKKIAETILKVRGVGEAIDHVTCNVSYIKTGNSEQSASSEYCEARVGYGVPVGIRASDVKESFEQLIKGMNLPNVEIEYIRIAEPTYTPAKEEIVQTALENANYIWNKEVIPVYQWATSDGKYYRYAGIPAIQYGPANIDGVHGYNECADIEDILNCAKTYCAVITDFLGVEF